MPQLPVSPVVSQPPGSGASTGQTAAAAFSAEGGDGLEGVQLPNFGAVLTQQMKGIAALLGGREDSSHARIPSELGENGEPAVNVSATPIFPIDFSALPASALPQFPALPQTLVAKLAAQTQTGASPAGVEAGVAKPVLELPLAGKAKLAAAEIADDGKNLPQMSSLEELFAHKLAAFTDVAADKAGGQLQLTDLSSAAGQPVAGVVDAAAIRQSEQLPAQTVAPRVGSAEWGGAVGEKVVWMANQGHQVAELHLNPPSLGPLEVRLTVSNDQASALFVSHHSAVREAIETALPRLREMLADSGIMLGNASVSAESFSQQQQASDQRRGGRDGGGGVLGVDGIAGLVAGNAMPTGLARDGMVDIFA